MLRRGSVVWARVPDPHGNLILDQNGNPKSRPALVLSTQDEIDSGGPLVVAAISTKFDRQACPNNWFLMESHPSGHPATGLNQPCVVKSDWLVGVEQNNIERVSPGVAARQTKQVLNWLAQSQK